MKRIIAYLLLLYCIVLVPVAAHAQSRVYNAPRHTFRLLAKQFAANANVFPIADPSLEGTPLTLANATGTSKADGSITVSFGAGFTAPITVTVYVWQQDLVNTAKAGWVRLGAAASQYSISVDSHYTTINFAISEQQPFLIVTSGAVTGDVYTDAPEAVTNANTVAGYPTR